MGTIVESTLPWLSNLVYDFVNVSSLVTRITVLQDKDSSFLWQVFMWQVLFGKCTCVYATNLIWQVFIWQVLFTGMVWTCQEKVFIENHDGQSHQILRLFWQVFFVDPYRRTKFVLWQFFLWQVHLFNRPFPLWVEFWSRYAWVTISSQLERASQN
jgi:hypothetical protein